MATANKLQVIIASGTDQGSRPDSGGLTLIIPTSADSSQVVKFDAQYWRIPSTYVATDVLYLSAYNPDTKRTVEYPLTYTGNLWEYTPDSTHFDAAGIRPGSSDTWTAQFYIRSDTGTGAAPISAMTDTFTLTVKRAIGVSPAKFGTPVGWWDAWDLSGTSGTTTVGTWYDKSGYERNLTEVTNIPVYYTDTIGRPMVRFDGSNDILTTAQNYAAGTDYTLLMALRLRTLPGSATKIAELGTGVTKVDLTYDTTNGVRATINASHSTIAATPLLQQTFVAGFTFDDGVDHAAVYNTSALSVTASAVTFAAGPLKIGGTSTFINADIFEIWLFNSELGTSFASNLEDATRALMAKWGI